MGFIINNLLLGYNCVFFSFQNIIFSSILVSLQRTQEDEFDGVYLTYLRSVFSAIIEE